MLQEVGSKTHTEGIAYDWKTGLKMESEQLFASAKVCNDNGYRWTFLVELSISLRLLKDGGIENVKEGLLISAKQNYKFRV